MNSNVLNMALQLSVQDMFSGSWFSNALLNKVWTEMMRSSVNGLIRNTGGADLLGAALGGSLRGDAAMLRQASSNVAEAQSMMNMAATAAGNIAGLLKEAKTLAGDFLDATQGLDLGTAGDMAIYMKLYNKFQPLYEAISNNIDSIIQNAKYNGIALLDGSAWGGDERLTVMGSVVNPAAASVHIQAGESGFPLTFNNMKPEFSGIAARYTLSKPIPGQPLWPGPPRPEVLTDLSSLQSSAQTLADLYAGRAGSLQSQTTSLQSQANILEEAAAQRAKTPAPVSTENLLLNLILRDSGGIFSGRG
jgi:flagellin